jgi:hypothetical protein
MNTICLLSTKFGKHFTEYEEHVSRQTSNEIARIDLLQALGIIQTINANNELSPVLLRVLRVVRFFLRNAAHISRRIYSLLLLC